MDKQTVIAHNIWERIEMSSTVLNQGSGVRELLRASFLRKQLDPDVPERERWGIKRISASTWEWEIANTKNLKGAETEKEIKYLPKDIEYIRDCIKLLMVRKSLLSTGDWYDLILKFYSLEELADMADEIDPIEEEKNAGKNKK